ncbi:DUF3830 family protein [Actinocatenispora sera]|uniref:DUF3830 family protein n=1 Tax=Actinocatenispora sera TaxID=390989 RepID=A0A810L7Y2_9ACTN|nr:DUF3830 family protein [Actinocatenispora sera]BCJ30722.1 hypothetical protein Asera_48300 [Actinocatenispora sera]
MMARFVEISLAKRGAVCVARLLDAEAPATCAAVWDALPVDGPAYHAKYARNEIYALLPALATSPPMEHPTVTPLPGDVCFFAFEGTEIGSPAYGYDAGSAAHGGPQVIDLALFYGRNNLLINGDRGFVPGSVFATVEQGLPAMAEAAQDMWLRGVEGERLQFRRLDDR